MDAPIRSHNGTLDLSNDAIEYWSKREPFLSTNRIFGRIECVTATSSRNGAALIVRGWIFERTGPISQLQIVSLHENRAITVYGLERLDVLAKFHKYPQARLSGFVSRFPSHHLETPLEMLQLRGSCISDDTQMNFIFEQHPVSYGVHQPGGYIALPANNPLPANPILVIAILGGVPLRSDIVGALSEYASLHNLLPVVFSDHSTTGLDAASSSPLWRNRVSVPCDSFAGSLWGKGNYVYQIVVFGSVDEKFLTKQLAPIMTIPSAPQISWIVSECASLELPPELRGFGVQILESSRCSASQLIWLISQQNSSQRFDGTTAESVRDGGGINIDL